MAAPDRLEELLKTTTVTGIDFIYVDSSQTVLDVFFLTDPLSLDQPLDGSSGTPKKALTQQQIGIYSPSGGETLPTVPIDGLAWTVSDTRNVLRITTKYPGDFSRYRLFIDDSRIDTYYNDLWFSFKANCKSDFDCRVKPHEYPIESPVDFPVDYSARDFWSLRQALLDFAALRYPDWKDRLEADLGMVLVELMSAIGDEFGYSQDRIGREAFLETASQRRSVRRHARLVDYDLEDGLGACTWLDITVDPGLGSGSVPAGTRVWESNERVVFEVGHGLDDFVQGKSFPVNAKRNSFTAHLWDEDDTCLPSGATTVYIAGSHKSDLPFDDFPPARLQGKWVLLKTNPKDLAVKARRWIVRLIEVEDLTDPIFDQNITKLTWEKEQATPFELDLEILEVRGNLIPATAGESKSQVFHIGPAVPGGGDIEAVERTGPNGSPAYLFSLPDSDSVPLVWLMSKEFNRPEVRLHEMTRHNGQWVQGDEWEWRRSLVGVSSSLPADPHFILDDGVWKRVVGYHRQTGTIEHVDYASGLGSTIRFGDGEFGLIPASDTYFQVTYRLGYGRAGNVAPDTLTGFDDKALDFIKGITNPLPGTGGKDPQPVEEVRQIAPEAFRAIAYRAVRPDDYAEAAERLEWVQRAGGVFRWTGSWLSAFVTPDPKGVTHMTTNQRRELITQLNRFRQAGRESHVLSPQFANLDLEITVCVSPSAYGGEVGERLLETLLGSRNIYSPTGFFAPDNFTFGTPLDRSALEASIQNVPGVRAVEEIYIRRRGWFERRVFSEFSYQPGVNEIIRVDNNPEFPECGSLRLIMKGGA